MSRPEIPFQLITPDIVRASIKRAKASLEKAANEIVWQIEREAWRTLGYSSWNAMREAEYGEAAFMVPSNQRPELVQRMRAKGLTQQEIADTAGVHESTVSRDLANASSRSEFPTITNERGQQRPATYARRNDGPEAKSAPSAPRRRPLPDAFRDTAYDLSKKVEALHRLTRDDRWTANAKKVAVANLGDLLRARDLLDEVINSLPDYERLTLPDSGDSP